MGHRIISRNEWGALPPRPAIQRQAYKEDPREVIEYIVVHKTHMRKRMPPRELQDHFFTSNRFQWNEIAYHYYITWDGKIYEGRAMKYVGGHAGQSKESLAGRMKGDPEQIKKDPDYGSIGIALSGFIDDDINRDRPSEAQIESLRWLLGYLRQEFSHVTADKVILHKEVDEKITKRRGFTPHPNKPGRTNCPGKGISGWLHNR